jgi:hypothetical protein
MHVVVAIATWGTVNQIVQDSGMYVMVGEGLIPQISWNVLGAEDTFCVPSPMYTSTVQYWGATPTLGLGTMWDWIGGDPNIYPLPEYVPPRPDCATVVGYPAEAENFGGALQIRAETSRPDPNNPGVMINETLYAEKKWGKINVTELFERDWDPYRTDFDLNWLSVTNCENCDMEIGSGSTEVIWDEEMKEFEAEVEIVELVWGTFPIDGIGEPNYVEMPANGAEVYWWILGGNAPVYDLPCKVSFSELEFTLDMMQAMYPPAHTTFFGAGGPIKTSTISGDDMFLGDGFTSIVINAEGEEAVKIVVVASYPDPLQEQPQWLVCPEIISWNFWTQQLEKVPQVRWAGEKIVLEKEFGTSFVGYPVRFSLENQSPGCLEPIGGDMVAADANPGIMPGPNGCQEVWTSVDIDGVARCILVSESPGEVDVDLAIYEIGPDGQMFNQHGFVVFFLKFEEIELSNVVGERVDNPLTPWPEGHNTGIWDPENPWDLSLDVDMETLNVSEDTLLRARVKGWFMGDDLSVRPEATLDLDGDTSPDMTLPAGRWVLPDDWPALAGPFWQQFRPHWDIMTQPNDDIMSSPDGQRTWSQLTMSWTIDVMPDKMEELGAYWPWITNPYTGVSSPAGPPVALGPQALPFPSIGVVGPFSSLDNYTPLANPVLGRKTIVRNGKLNWWDCPMPPAKMIFLIESGVGFFKETDKGDVYYHLQDMQGFGPTTILYTNPFYQIMVPAGPEIPPFLNNGGYDWDSWNPAYGPYDFWEIFNQPPGITPDHPQHPTMIEVYSDNHGEAMVYLNGDWNLDLMAWITNGAFDVPPGTVVGVTSATAIADYPYLRKHPVIVSGDVTKTWTWGKEILGTDPANYNDGSSDPDQRMVIQVGTFTSIPDGGDGISEKKMAFVWVCDRDGMPVVGERIDWIVEQINGEPVISGLSGCGLSQYLDPAICIEGGFLAGTMGQVTVPQGGVAGTQGTSYTRMPTPEELALFAKFFGIENWHHAVAAVELISSDPGGMCDLKTYFHEREGTIVRYTNIDWSVADAWDDPMARGDADQSGGVNMGDVTCVERIILGLNPETETADANANGSVDMGDVTKIERIILGL